MNTLLEDFFINTDFLQGLSHVEKKKHFQKLRILRFLYLQGPTTNAEICNAFNFSLPTSMALINQLIKEGLIVKQGRGESVGGRKPDLFAIKPGTFFVLSIHIDRFNIKLAIVDNTNSTIIEEDIPSKISSEVNIVDTLFNYATALIEESEVDTNKLLGIGISMPGLVSSKEGKNFTYFLSGQESLSLQAALKKQFDKPVYILNDAKSACLAEFRFGEAKNKEDVLVISMDWGIGLGIVMGGKMHTGTSGFAGEFGHIPMVEDGELCHCGKRGCLETIASGLALVNKAKKGLAAGETSLLSSMVNDDSELNPEIIIEAANRGDQFSINILSEIGSNLGKGIAILIQIFNPELVILEGKIAEAKKFITTPIQQSMNTFCMIQLKEKTKIVLSKLGRNSHLLGSTAAVVNNVFKNQLKLENDIGK
ncbi:sugar kinase [Christiangramia fulva]|uniref:Sugar kinase n=1 Tax=Christiangramia fulva TaxID=2126553 RepID=A0A2R3Z4C4_9FLAO|nr:ROK family transcriptional regulator [Christiangramia fulva]AVR45133.1 sugar kinase [Christiangramia fulva]